MPLNHLAPLRPYDHLTKHEEYCRKWAESFGDAHEFDTSDWVYQEALDQQLGGWLEDRVIIHRCSDGEGYSWTTGGLYEDVRDSDGPEEWRLVTAFNFGGDPGELYVFWSQGKWIAKPGEETFELGTLVQNPDGPPPDYS